MYHFHIYVFTRYLSIFVRNKYLYTEELNSEVKWYYVSSNTYIQEITYIKIFN